MSGMFSSVFNPGLEVSDGSGDQANATDASEAAPADQSHSTAQSDTGEEQYGGESSGSLGTDADLDLGGEVTLSNRVEMTYVDEEGNVSTYARSDELTIGADVGAAAETVLGGASGYDGSSDDFSA